MILLLALGLVLVIEGLVLALAPLRMEQLLAALATMTPEQRRMLGLGSVAAGVMLVALARWLGA
ncbi:MAG: DUF2065 family protein [Paracoccaceae bacterium]